MPRYYLPKINKYVTFSASIAVGFSAGLSYLFGVWSPALKEAYNLSQKDLQTIAAVGNLGGYSSFISGLVYDSLEHRHHVGPRLSLIMGCLTTSIGFFGLWAAITKRFIATTWQLAALAALAGNGGTWFDTCCLATNLRNFPAQRGPIVGIIKAGVGLSSSIYSAAYIGAFQPRIDNFLLFLAITPATVGLLAVPLMNYVPYIQQSELEGGYYVFSPEGRQLLALQTIGTLALYLMATALATAFGVSSKEAQVLMALGVLVLFCPLLLIPVGSGGLFAKKVSGVIIRAPTDLYFDDRENTNENNNNTADQDLNGGGEPVAGLRQPLLEPTREQLVLPDELENTPATSGLINYSMNPIMPSYSVSQCFRLAEFYMLAFIAAIAIGCGLSFLNNIAALVSSLSGPAEARSVLITLFGVASCTGRLTFGIVPEKMLHLYGIPRPVFVVVADFFLALTLFGLAYATFPLMYALAGCAGLAFGAHWSLMPSLSSEIFGLDSFASIYTILQLFPAAAAYLIGSIMVTNIYESTGRKHGDPAGTCLGIDCFQNAFLIMAGLVACAGCVALWLTVRTLKLYRVEAAALRTFDLEAEHH
jgi:MFS family permease